MFGFSNAIYTMLPLPAMIYVILIATRLGKPAEEPPLYLRRQLIAEK
jgi:hypothetical protein